MSAAFWRKYATATHVFVPLIKRNVVDFAVAADYTPAAGDVRVSIDGATSANIGTLPTAISMGNTAMWDFTLSTGETTGKKIMVTVADAATKVVEDQMFLVETYGNASAEYPPDFSLANLPANVVQIDGAANATHASGMFPADVRDVVGAAVSTTTAQLGVNVVSTSANAITSTSLATDSITSTQLAASAVTEIRSLANGTADSGTTTTMVDAALTQADTDYWVGELLVFTSGNIAGQSRIITAFNPATDTITFTPAVTQAVSTQNYEIFPIADFLRPTVSGRTLDVTATGEAGLDWANMSGQATAQNLSSTTISTVSGSVGSVAGNVGGNVTGSIGSLAAQAKTDVNNEVLDTLTVDTYSEPGQGSPGVNISLKDKIGYLYKFLRNKITQDATTLRIFADDTTTVDQKAVVSDDGTTYTRNEIATGP